MTTRYRRRGRDATEDEAVDAEGILRDGFSVSVPMTMRDARVTDADGTTSGLHRPGFRVADNAAMRDAKQEAYDAYLRDVTNAWRAGGAESREGAENSICTVRNAQYPRAQGVSGHVRNGICVPDDEELRDALPTRDSNMADVYAAYDARIREMWRNP